MLLVVVDRFKMVSSLDEAESCSHMYMSAFLWQTLVLVSNSKYWKVNRVCHKTNPFSKKERKKKSHSIIHLRIFLKLVFSTSPFLFF